MIHLPETPFGKIGTVRNGEAAMSEKPQKRMVSKGKYAQAMGRKVGRYTLAILMACFGIVEFLCMLFCWFAFEDIPPIRVVAVLIFAVCTYAIFLWAKLLFSDAKSVESVAPITDRNVHLLPPQETLVRGSEEPPMAL